MLFVIGLHAVDSVLNAVPDGHVTETSDGTIVIIDNIESVITTTIFIDGNLPKQQVRASHIEFVKHQSEHSTDLAIRS